MQKIMNPLMIVQKTEGGEITGDGAHLVTVYDYDGAVLKREKLDAGEFLAAAARETPETARPWTKPYAGTTDMYHAGEYMVWTDGTIKNASVIPCTAPMHMRQTGRMWTKWIRRLL